jgi:HEAT repeat protein
LAAVQGLRGFPESKTVLPLLEVCRDEREELAQAAREVLGLPGHSAQLGVQQLLDLYDTGSAISRTAAVHVSLRHHPTESATMLSAAAKDPDMPEGLRASALDRLADSDPEIAAPALLEAARSGSRRLRILALSGLRILARRVRAPGMPVRAEDLEDVCSDPDPGVGRAAVEAVGAIGGLAASRIVRQAMQNEHAAVRLGAYNALFSFDRPAYADALWQAVEDPSGLVRLGVAEALPSSAPSEAAAAIGTLLGDRVPNVRLAAVAALARSGNVDALGLVAECVGAPDPDMALLAHDLIRQVGGAHAVARTVLNSTYVSVYDRARALLRLDGIDGFDVDRYLHASAGASRQETLAAVTEMRSLLRAAGEAAIAAAESQDLLRRAGPSAHEKHELLRARLPNWVRSDRDLLEKAPRAGASWAERLRRLLTGE